MMHQQGQSKLVEECGELIQVVAKRMAYGDDVRHPDGAGDLKKRMEDEMGDVLAAIRFVTEKLNLNSDRIDDRVAEKLAGYKIWDGEP